MDLLLEVQNVLIFDFLVRVLTDLWPHAFILAIEVHFDGGLVTLLLLVLRESNLQFFVFVAP